MQINTNTIVSVTEANQNFSRVTRIVEKNGQAVIFKNNRPKYMVIDLENSPMLELTDDDVSETGLAVASGKMDYVALLQWVRDHRI